MLCERFVPQPAGGAGRAAGDLAHALHAQGCTVDVLTTAAGGAPGRTRLAPGLQAIALPIEEEQPGPRATRELVSRLQATVDLASVDVVHDNGGFFPALLPLARQLRAVCAAPFLLQLQIQWGPLLRTEGFDDATIAARIETQRGLVALADRVLVLSEDEAAEARCTLDVAPDTLCCVANPIVPRRYAALPPRPQRDVPVIGLGGRLNARSKGADIALEALAHVAHEYAFHLKLLGHAPAVPLPDVLADRARHTGWLDESGTAAALADCDLFLVPSRYEPFGLLAAEALAAGTPVIVARTGGLREIVQDGETGRTVAPAAGAAGWCAALRDFFAAPARHQAWADAGRAHVLQAFDVARIAQQTVQHYRALAPVPEAEHG